MGVEGVRQFASGPGGRFVVWCIAASVVLAACGCLLRESQDRDSGLSAMVEGKAIAETGPVDNSECLICHMDFKAEVLSAVHEKAGIGCTTCHGVSLAHGDDELNITPADRLFGRAEIVPFCKSCHPTHKRGKVYDAFLDKWHSRRRPNGRMVLADSVCTDCHGNHAVLRVDQQQLMSE